jgi:hypothetical protein
MKNSLSQIRSSVESLTNRLDEVKDYQGLKTRYLDNNKEKN